MTQDKPMPSCLVELKVPFHDLDPLRVVWHGNYLKYFEIARDQLFDDHGLNLYRFAAEEQLLFPVIRTSTKHIAPLRWGDRFACEATLVEANAKLVVAYRITRLPNGELCARGKSEQVAVTGDDGTLQFRLPDPLRRAFGLDE